MGLFDYDVDKFTAWLETSDTKSLSAIFKAFRALFTEPKPKADKPKADPKTADGEAAETPQVDVVIAALAFLTPAERHLVVEACVVLGVELPQDDVVDETVAA